MSPTAAPTTPDRSSAKTGKGTVHTSPRATEDIETEAKNNGKESSHKEKYKIIKTNKNNNLGFMYVIKTVKNFKIHDKETIKFQEFLSSRPLLAQDFPCNKTTDLKKVWARPSNHG